MFHGKRLLAIVVIAALLTLAPGGAFSRDMLRLPIADAFIFWTWALIDGLAAFGTFVLIYVETKQEEVPGVSQTNTLGIAILCGIAWPLMLLGFLLRALRPQRRADVGARRR
jgi:hypothetical protein